MCLANIYQNENGGKLITKDIAYLKIAGDQIEVMDLAGQTSIVPGRIKEIDFMNSDIIVEKPAQQSPQDSTRQ